MANAAAIDILRPFLGFTGRKKQAHQKAGRAKAGLVSRGLESYTLWSSVPFISALV